MDLRFLQYTDAELVVLATIRQCRREAKREIHRRKRIGSWKLIANWKAQIEQEEEAERVYAPGVQRNGS